jgi:hypothetical protein
MIAFVSHADQAVGAVGHDVRIAAASERAANRLLAL